MKNRWSKTAIIGLIAVLVMSLGAIAVFAQDDTTPDDTQARPALPYGRQGYHGGHHDGFHGRSPGYGGANDEAMAEALGITVEELQAARQKAAAERIAQALEDGLLTRDQANTMLAMQALKGFLDREALMAQAFGLTAEEFAAAREAGTLFELLGDIDMTELHEKMQTAVEAAIDQAVDDNVITAEQAALVKEQLENGLGMHGGFGGSHHEFYRGHGRDPTDSAAAPSATATAKHSLLSAPSAAPPPSTPNF